MKNHLLESYFKFEIAGITKPGLGRGRHSFFSTSLRTVFTLAMKIYIKFCLHYTERIRSKLDLQLFCGCSFKRNIDF